jgi:hypothetical protein
MVQHAVSEATGTQGEAQGEERRLRPRRRRAGSGNLGLVYLMEIDRRLTREEIDARHPELIPTLRAHPHIGWLLVRSAEHGAVVLGPDGVSYLDEGASRASTRSRTSPPPRPATCCAPTASRTSPTS